MDEKSKLVLELTNTEAKDFFLKNESYVNFNLPNYFTFCELLNKIDNLLVGKELSEFYKPKNDSKSKYDPRNYEGNNHVLFNNKDGKYAWRPLELIHPAIYVSLVNKITDDSHWKTITTCFAKFRKNEKITCLSIPVKSLSDKKDKAEQVSKWWRKVEQRSVELALDYEYILQTDITDCYGSIYTHSIAWALHGKKTAKEHIYDKSLIGNVIDRHIRDMRFGQTNGIPQGSTLMDFIAEMVLGYTDQILSEKIKKEAINDFHIIRYRDDYRIFTNNLQEGETILKLLTDIMIDFGMKLNASKTTSSSDVIRSSIKADKLAWLEKKQTAKTLQKKLLIIHGHAKQYPGSGSLIVALDDFLKKLEKSEIKETVMPLISITVDITFHNPKSYPITVTILSYLIASLNKDKTKQEVCEKINEKFKKITNTGHLQLWLQRLTLQFEGEFQYDEKLCKKVDNNETELWCLDWLKEDMKRTIKETEIVNRNEKENAPSVIDRDEVTLYPYN